MPNTGALAHIDISVGYPEKSIPFYAAFFEALGYRRREISLPEWQGDHRRATEGSARALGGLTRDCCCRTLSSSSRASRAFHIFRAQQNRKTLCSLTLLSGLARSHPSAVPPKACHAVGHTGPQE